MWSVVFAFAEVTEPEALRVPSRTSVMPILYRQSLSVAPVVTLPASHALLKMRQTREATAPRIRRVAAEIVGDTGLKGDLFSDTGSR